MTVPIRDTRAAGMWETTLTGARAAAAAELAVQGVALTPLAESTLDVGIAAGVGAALTVLRREGMLP